MKKNSEILQCKVCNENLSTLIAAHNSAYFNGMCNKCSTLPNQQWKKLVAVKVSNLPSIIGSNQDLKTLFEQHGFKVVSTKWVKIGFGYVNFKEYSEA